MTGQSCPCWTQQKLDDFKAALEDARRRRRTVFNFEGHDFLVPYAIYLVQYLETRSLTGGHHE